MTPPADLHATTAAGNISGATVVDVALANWGAASAGDYVQLLKPRVMSLVVFTGLVGLYLAPGEALGFGAVLAAGAILVLGLAVNWAAAALLALTIAFYVFVYTMWLKRRTPQNIVIGGAAGAFPPMIGWAAVTGDISLVSLALFAIIFMWTPPHFWALSLYRQDDYAKAGVPMMPVVAGARATRRQMLAYAVLLLPLALAPWWLGIAGAVYGLAALLLGGLMIVAAVRVMVRQTERSAKQMFGFSILYLFLLFALLIVDRAPGLLAGGWAGGL